MLGYTPAECIVWIFFIRFFSFHFVISIPAQPNLRDLCINTLLAFLPQTRNLVFFPSSQGFYMYNTRFHENWLMNQKRSFVLSACKQQILDR